MRRWLAERGFAMQLGMIGLGRMGANMVRRLLRAGSTALSVNLPEVAPPRPEGLFRMGYLHENLPGVMAGINQVLADAGVNVVGQSLSTRGGHGYVVTDTDAPLSDTALAGLRGLPQTVWLRTWRP